MRHDLLAYQLSSRDLFHALETNEHGLSDMEAKRRLKQYGPNQLTAKKKVSALSLYLSQFQNSLIIILLVAASLIFFVWYFGQREQADLIEGSLIVAIILMITLL